MATRLLERCCFLEDPHAVSLENQACVVSVSMGPPGAHAVSEARASACVSIYSRTFVSLPFRTVMANTQWSSNVLFVALILPVAKPTTMTRSPCAMNSGGFGYEVSTVLLAF